MMSGVTVPLAGDSECALEVRLCFRGILLRLRQRDFAGNAIDLGLEPPFLGFLDRNDRFADATPSIIKLAKVRYAAFADMIGKRSSQVSLPLIGKQRSRM